MARNNKLAQAIANHINKKADMDIVSLQGIIDDLNKISEMCYSEEIDPVFIAEKIDFVIDDLEGWKPYVTNNIKSSKKTAAYPFYEMVKDTTPLYTPNDPIGVQSGTEDTEQIANLFPEINKDMLNTDFVQKGYSNEYPFTQVDIDQLQKGIEVELEHTTDRNVAAKIALDHLAEISNYYDLLEEMEQKAKEMGTYLLNKENKVNE